MDQCARILLAFNRRDVGVLRRLIDRLNSLVVDSESPAREAAPHEIREETMPEAAEEAEEAEDDD